MGYTAVPTVSTGELWTAANQNTYLRDNMTELEARSVVQFPSPALAAYNETDVTAIYRSDDPSFLLPDSKKCQVWGNFILPSSDDFDISVAAIVAGGAGGDIYSRLGYYYGAIGSEAWSANSDTGSLSATTLTGTQMLKVNDTAIAGFDTGTLATFFFERDATNALDTINSSAFVYTFLITITVS